MSSAKKRRAPNNLQEHIAHQRTAEVWQGLNHLYLECNALRTSPAQALSLLRNVELVKKVADQNGLLDAAKVLDKDVREYTNQLTAIYGRHQELFKKHSGDIDMDGSLMLTLIAVGEEYSNWITSYQLVVIPAALNVTNFFESAIVAQTQSEAPSI